MCSACREIVLQERLKKQVNRRLSKLKNTTEYGIGLVKKYADGRFWASVHNNCFRASFGKKGETDAHRDKKYERWCYHRKLGRTVFTELILKKNLGRPDLVVVDKGFVFAEEIIMSEKEASIIEKRKKYPFPINKIYAKKGGKNELKGKI